MFEERTIHKLALCVGMNLALFLSSRTESYCHVITISTVTGFYFLINMLVNKAPKNSLVYLG
jgi:hypothetical protein